MVLPNNLIERISSVLDEESTLEGLVRHLLEMLELVTNMESTYLTSIEADGSLQHVLFSRNSKKMHIPEGLSVPWQDTLCKRALDEKCRFTNDVTRRWGDSQAATALGIVTYVSTPVILADGSLYGTLCAASSAKRTLSEHSAQVLQLFSQLIAQQIQSEQQMKALQAVNVALQKASYTDELTGLPNRRAVFDRLPRLFAEAGENARYVILAFTDLDGFKRINDAYGHETGDDFLRAVGQRLKEHMRGGEVLARIGGDEFIVAGEGPGEYPLAQEAADALAKRISRILSGEYQLATCSIDYPGPSIGALAVNPGQSTPDRALREADSLMYIDKKRRKALTPSTQVNSGSADTD